MDNKIDVLTSALFRELVEDDISKEAPCTELRSAALCQRWRETLVIIQQDLDAQLSMRRAELESFLPDSSVECRRRRTEYFAWRRRCIYYRTLVTKAFNEAKALCNRYKEGKKQDYNCLYAANQELENCIDAAAIKIAKVLSYSDTLNYEEVLWSVLSILRPDISEDVDRKQLRKFFEEFSTA